jgi:hypothetical protein
VKPECVTEFESVYGSEGDWAILFRNSPFYRGTQLLRKQSSPPVYEVVDLWEDLESYEQFKADFQHEYEALDRKCERLTVKETPIGHFYQEA